MPPASPPRVHLFARPPVIGDRSTPAAPLGEDLGSGTTEWVAVTAPGQRPAPGALARLGQAVTLAPGARVITADDERRLRWGARARPRLRPGPSPDHWLAADPDFGLMAVAREPALAALRDGACPHELFLRLSGPHAAGHAHVPEVLSVGRGGGVGREAPSVVEAVLSDWEPGARVEVAGARLRVRRPPAAEPAVEAMVLFRDRPELLERCAASVLERSSYERLTLGLVDNASTDPGIPPLLERLGRQERVTVRRDPRPFNFSALNNAVASKSSADVLVFLNNDTQVLDSAWVEDLLEEALRPEVGAVAPLLAYPDGRVQHAGAAVGIHGWAGHPFAGLRPDQQTPFGSAGGGTRNWLAVSAACMMVEKRKFDEVGGFDESFAVGGGDVDLCLRLTVAGHRSLCVPHVRLIHDESATRDPTTVAPGDFEASRRSYGEFRTVGDPFYHPALTLRDTTCRLRAPDEQPPPP
jgi:GT2 family glycosyltransferase